MDIKLLSQNHNIRVGDHVIVKERAFPHTQYGGSVYRIVNKSMNEHIRDYKDIMVDHFYIQFNKEIYHLLLKRGLDVIYQHQPVVLGDVKRDKSGKIVQLFTQKMFLPETEIHLDDINAILCWRVAYDIQKA